MFDTIPELKAELVKKSGVILITDLLEIEQHKNNNTLYCVLRIVNKFVENSAQIQENLCLVGAIPSMMKFSNHAFSKEVRLQAAAFLKAMWHNPNAFPMFIACKGLPVLCDLLEDNFKQYKDLVLLGIDGIWDIFTLQTPNRPKNDFCRLFTKCRLLDRLSCVLQPIIEEKLNEYIKRIVTIFLWFSASDVVVKQHMSEQKIIERLLQVIDTLEPTLLVSMLKAIKNVSMDPMTLDNLAQAGTIQKLIKFLGKREGPVTEMHNQVLNCMYNLLYLSADRQALAVGIVPHLQYFAFVNGAQKELALSIICDFAKQSRITRAELWKYNGVEFYVSLLSIGYWQVLAMEALAIWLAEENRVENVLIKPENISGIVSAFSIAQSFTFVSLLQPLHRIITLSKPINKLLGVGQFVTKLLDRLQHPTIRDQALIQLNLLKMLKEMYFAHANPKQMIAEQKLLPIIKNVADNAKEFQLVSAVAFELLEAFKSNEAL